MKQAGQRCVTCNYTNKRMQSKAKVTSMTPAGEALIKHWSHKANAITSRICTLGLRGSPLEVSTNHGNSELEENNHVKKYSSQ